jgi:hypothetical protein
LGTNDPEVAIPLVTGTVKVAATPPVHVVLFGPYRLKVTVPVGLNPPARVAVSKIVPPSVTPGDACVLIVGVARVTTTDSLGSLQAVPARRSSPTP